jgi:hypothetical protein
MNSKHAASFVLFLLIGAMGYGTMVMKNKLNEMQEAESAAQQTHDMAMTSRQTEQSLAQKLTRETEGKREYLGAWKDYFAQINSEAKAVNLFNSRVKMGGFLALNKKASLVAIVNTKSSINNVVKATLTFEDDYKKTMEWFGSFETGIPATRVSDLKLSKGQSGDEIRLELGIDFPLMADSAVATLPAK